ncbi:hypothetical protein G2285_00018 [Escherichia phage vB_EcoM_G2285]|nr:hypothetical protein G2285_00018 [Escherichia phage vB_EcoM_G2285]
MTCQFEQEYMVSGISRFEIVEIEDLEYDPFISIIQNHSFKNVEFLVYKLYRR